MARRERVEALLGEQSALLTSLWRSADQCRRALQLAVAVTMRGAKAYDLNAAGRGRVGSTPHFSHVARMRLVSGLTGVPVGQQPDEDSRCHCDRNEQRSHSHKRTVVSLVGEDARRSASDGAPHCFTGRDR
jgi:hypothetical protein